jgi:hypothetical protein
VFSRTCLAGLSVLFHNEKFILFLLSCVACCVLCESVLAHERPYLWGVAVVKAESPDLISFLSSLMCRPWGIRLKRERSQVVRDAGVLCIAEPEGATKESTHSLWRFGNGSITS